MLMAGLDRPCPRAARRGAGPEPRLIGGPLMAYNAIHRRATLAGKKVASL
jgi:hypothetical protein